MVKSNPEKFLKDPHEAFELDKIMDAVGSMELPRSIPFDEIVDSCMLCKVDISNDVNEFVRSFVFPHGDDWFVMCTHSGKVGLPGPIRFDIIPDMGIFGDSIGDAVIEEGYRPVSLEYMDAEHLIWGQPSSNLPEAVLHLLMYLLDEYMPTGILKMEEIDRATDIVNSIEQKIFWRERVDESLSNKFYESIPQNGPKHRRKMINSKQMCRNKLDVIMRLRSALRSLLAGVRSTLNPIDYFARDWLQTKLYEIDRRSIEFLNLNRCVSDTQHPNERCFILTNVFKINSTSASGNKLRSDMHNQCLLYHFTFPCNILGILREGLIVAPNHIYSQNRFMGRGIYFWDCASMALNAFNIFRRTPVLLVCRVALGNQQEVKQMYLQEDEKLRLDPGKDSVFYRANCTSVEICGAQMYCGQVPCNDRQGKKNFNDYNKYMVQQSCQVKLEYILQFKKIN